MHLKSHSQSHLTGLEYIAEVQLADDWAVRENASRQRTTAKEARIRRTLAGECRSLERANRTAVRGGEESIPHLCT